MPYVLARNIRAISDVKVRKLMSLFNIEEKEEIIKRVTEILDKLEIPDSISDVGVEVSEVDNYVEEVVSYKRNLDNNPISVDKKLIRDLVIEALRGRREFMKKFLKYLVILEYR